MWERVNKIKRRWKTISLFFSRSLRHPHTWPSPPTKNRQENGVNLSRRARAMPKTEEACKVRGVREKSSYYSSIQCSVYRPYFSLLLPSCFEAQLRKLPGIPSRLEKESNSVHLSGNMVAKGQQSKMSMLLEPRNFSEAKGLICEMPTPCSTMPSL